MYGVLLPAPDVGRNCAAEMRTVRDAGFECGIHTWDHEVGQDKVRHRDSDWTARQMQQAFQRFTEVFGHAPRTHGAAGWQMNAHAFRQLDALGIAYASDGRAMLTEDGALADPAIGPHRLAVDGKALSCIQMPTTLPTLDELLGRTIGGTLITPANVAALLLRLTENRRDHVYTLHAELEGQKLAPIFDALLSGWKAQGYRFASMSDYYRQLDQADLPVRSMQWGALPGRSGELIVS
jgi:peptidoglycan/xylan/chitin deacetylase (PgdA/CDA1 family)